MAVPAFPRIRLTDTLAAPGEFARFLSGYTRLYTAGRDAVYFACRGLRLDPDVPVWLPAFHCGVEVQAVLDAGSAVGFYRVRPDLSIDESDLFRKLDARPGPVLLIHYFGFPQPGILRIARQCAARKIPLIEDCAHALFSKHEGTPVGEFAPIAIYSLRKTLPIYDGGALAVQANRILAESGNGFEYPGSFPAAGVFARAGKDLGRRAAGPVLTRAYRRIRYGKEAGLEEETRVNTVISERRVYGAGISRLSRRIARAVDPTGIVQSRRFNWSALARMIEASMVFPNLSEGTCPLFLPIWVKDRARLAAKLANSGVETFIFGEFPHPLLPLNEYPEARCLRDNIFCLPVHHQLRETDLRYIATAWEQVLQNL